MDTLPRLAPVLRAALDGRLHQEAEIHRDLVKVADHALEDCLSDERLLVTKALARARR